MSRTLKLDPSPTPEAAASPTHVGSPRRGLSSLGRANRFSRQLLALTVVLTATLACRRAPHTSPTPQPKTKQEQAFYALGATLADNLQVFSVTESELALVKAGFADAASKRPLRVDVASLQGDIQHLALERRQVRTELERKKGALALEQAAKQPGARSLPSGVVLLTLRPGTGKSPGPLDRVKLDYEGRLLDGTVIDSSYQRHEAAEFHLQSVARCWIDGIQAMKVGEKARLTCPSSLAYGESGHPPLIPGAATLVFDIDLLEITSSGSLEPTPSSSAR